MLSKARISAVIPVTDLARARQFYEGVLGLAIAEDQSQQGAIVYEASGTHLTVYQRASASSGDHTIAGFRLSMADFEAVADQLIAAGVIFNTFDMPGMENAWDARGVLTYGDNKAAWFTDPDGNILSVGTLAR